jgi:hypothetical protein
MDDRGLSILKQLIADIEGAPSPGVVGNELYSIWYEHSQSVAQEALEYLNVLEPAFVGVDELPLDFT